MLLQRLLVNALNFKKKLLQSAIHVVSIFFICPIRSNRKNLYFTEKAVGSASELVDFNFSALIFVYLHETKKILVNLANYI